MTKKEEVSFSQFISELEADIVNLEELKKTYTRALERVQKGRNDTLDTAVLVYTVYDIHSLIEKFFLRVRKFFEDKVEPESWYSALLKRSITHTMDLMNGLFATSLVVELDELHSFREPLKSLYEFHIDPEKVEWLQEELPKVLDIFTDSHELVISQLRELLAAAV